MPLLLVCHAMPVVSGDLAAHRLAVGAQGLGGGRSARGRLAIRRVPGRKRRAQGLPDLAAAGVVYRDPRLNEVSRDEPFDSDFRAARRGYVEGMVPPGWEPREEVVAEVRRGGRGACHAGPPAGRWCWPATAWR